jgi:hypothetical protein
MKNNREELKIRSIRTSDFMDLFNKLPKNIKDQAIGAFNKWKDDPSMLGFKPVEANPIFWSAKIGDHYRAVAKKAKTPDGKNCYVWTWIGSHSDYNHELTRLKNHKRVADVVNRVRGDTSQPQHGKKLK